MSGQERIVFLNDAFVEQSEAKISPFDMGFMFGSSVYEVTYVYNGTIFTLDLHLDRLFKCTKLINLEIGKSREEITKLSNELVAKNSSWFNTGIIYMQVSFGGEVGLRSNILPVVKELKPTIFMFVQSFTPAPVGGIKLKSYPDRRWKMCHIKVTSLLANMLSGVEAKKEACDEALLYDPRLGDAVLEGSNTNVFAVFNNELYTYPICPEAGDRILHGCTRLVILGLAKELGIKAHEEPFSLGKLKAEATEVFISSTTKEVCPVSMVDDVEKPCPGPISLRLLKAFIEKVEKECPSYKPHPKRQMHPSLSG